MTAQSSMPQSAPTTNGSPARVSGLRAERVGARRYVGHNSRGATVQMGPDTTDGVFTPGELMMIALAGCSGMSADHPLARRLGADVDITVHVSGMFDRGHYTRLDEELVVDLSSLDEAELERISTVVRRAIEKYCTVGRTLERSADVGLTITSPDGS